MKYQQRIVFYVWTFFAAISSIVVVTLFGLNWVFQPVTARSAVSYEITRGDSVIHIAQELKKLGWIEYPRVWSLWARFNGLSNKFRAGEYSLKSGMTPDSILKLFTSGKVILHSLTIVEGTTFADLKAVLLNREDIQHTLGDATDAELMLAMKMPGMHPEGQFFPDTYQFAKNTSDLNILRMAQKRMQDELSTAWENRDVNAMITSPYQLLILASIIEKETANSNERKKIAGVFTERLERGMRLQTDPSIIYGLGEGFDGNLKKMHLLHDGPYNTYTRQGLPPTPISLPGAASLFAAAHPERTGYIYFVATGKPDGTHYFSKTLQEHNVAIRRYLAMTKQSKR